MDPMKIYVLVLLIGAIAAASHLSGGSPGSDRAA
jgi:hypothetical protein